MATGEAASERQRAGSLRGAIGQPLLLVLGFAALALVGGYWSLLDIYGQLQAQALLAAAPAVLVALLARL
ncbi:MAG TPA: hypothetical protein VJ890_21760, partial [Vineibacter sp.]|nr:hypothetical protein [Vineibacter sp.]